MVQDFLFWMKVHWISPTCIPNTRLGIKLWIWFCQLKDHGNIPILSNARNFNSSRWPIYIINSFGKTKLACYTSPPTQYTSFIKNLAAFTTFKLVENKFCFILFIYLFICQFVDQFHSESFFYSMIPSLDDVKFCRKRKGLKKTCTTTEKS